MGSLMKTSTLAVQSEADSAQATPSAAEYAIYDQDIDDRAPADRSAPGDTPANAIVESLVRVDWPVLAASWTVRLASLAIGIGIWHLLCAIKFKFFINFENVPAPLVVLNALIGHLHESIFYIHIAVSMKRILIGFALATLLGISLGVIMGRSKIARNFVTPYIEILRPIPAVAWIPLAILMWPTEESSIIYITFLGALFPIVLNTVHGVEQTPEVLVRAAQSLGASPLQIFWHVVMPAALPSIATGLAIGMGVSWFSLLAGEIISGQYGIGYFTWNAYSLIKYPDIVVGMLVIGGLGTLSTQAVRKITQPLLSWQRKSR
jgi:NitT/TauT family transport system permease protein